MTASTTRTAAGASHMPSAAIPADEAEVRRFLAIISSHAQAVCAGNGRLQLSRVNPSDNKLRVSGRFTPHDVDGMTACACEDAAAGYNSYIEFRTVRPDLPPSARGEAADTVEVFGLAQDYDADTGRIAELPISASLITETSPGNRHNILLTERLPISDATEIGARMRELGGDHDTGNPVQPYRISGTPNYPNLTKQQRGRVAVHMTRVIELNGAVYTAEQLRKAFPAAKRKANGSGYTNRRGDESSRKAEWDLLPDDLKHLIENGAQPGERSDQFHHAVGWLKQLHWRADDIIDLLERYPDGIARKYRRRLIREVNRCFDKCDDPEHDPDIAADTDQGGNTTQDALLTSRAADSDMAGIDWFWPGRFALGKIGLIAGLPDKGKGQIAAFLTAATTANKEFPFKEGQAPQGSVIWFNAEDDVRDTIIPRLVAAGADLTKVHFVNCAQVKGKNKAFSLVTDLHLLRKKIDEISDVMLIIIDPMSAYLGVGKVDSRQATDVRSILTPLKELAEQLHVLALGIAHFNKKDDIKSALLRVSDSIAYVAAARHVYAVLDDPEDHTLKLFVKAKNNLAPEKITALKYGFGVNTNVGHDAKLNLDISAPYIMWMAQTDIAANDAMAAADGHSSSTKREAREFLQEALREGPVLQQEVIADAKANGISQRTLRRAKDDLKVQAYKARTANGGWMWGLPKMRNPPQRE
jgi:putative DNA primase/helicase